MKRIFVIIMAFCLCPLFTGCYDSNEISKQAYIIAIGIDKAGNTTKNYTFQLINPSAFNDSGSDKQPLVSATINDRNVYSALDKLNTSISEKCDYSHLKLLIFSMDYAKDGLQEEIESMLKSDIFHPNTRVAVSFEDSSDYLNSNIIPFDTNPSEYYENLFKKNYTVYATDTRLRDFEQEFFNHKKGNVTPILHSSNYNEEEKRISYKHNEMAILNDARLVNTADEKDIVIYNLLSNKNYRGNMTVRLCASDESVINIEKKKLSIKTEFFEKKLVVSAYLSADADIAWSECKKGSSVLPDNYEVALKEQIESDITGFLYKCSRIYKTDILGICNYAKKYYLTTSAWESEIWQDVFENADYNVNVKIKLQREGININ